MERRNIEAGGFAVDVRRHGFDRLVADMQHVFGAGVGDFAFLQLAVDEQQNIGAVAVAVDAGDRRIGPFRLPGMRSFVRRWFRC